MEYTNIALKKIAKGAGIFSIGLFISKLLAYAYRLIIARIGVEQYGLLSIALAFFNIMIAISLLGMSEGLIRFIAHYKGKEDARRIKGVITSALKITLPLSVIAGLFLFFASEWIAVKFFHNASLSLLLKIFSFCVPFDVLRTIFFSSIKAFQKVEYEVYGKVIAENVTKVGLTLIAVYLGFGVTGAAVAYASSVVISFCFSLYFMEKKVFPVFKTQVTSIRSDKLLLTYSIPLLFTGFVYLIIQWTDTLMLGYFKTSAEVGVYNVALPTAFLLYFFPSAIRTLFFPVLSEIHAQNKIESFKTVYRTVTKWILIIDLIIFVFLISFSRQILSFFFGGAYVVDKFSFLGYAPATSVLALVILTSGTILIEFLGPAKEVLLVLKKTKLIFFNTILGAIFNVVFGLILIPAYGVIGAAIVTSFSYVIIFALMGVEAFIITRINPFKRSYIKIIFSATIILFLVFIFKLYSIQNIIWVTILGLCLSVLYFCLLLFTKSFEREDLLVLNSLQKKLRLNINFDKIIGRFVE